MIVLRTPKGWTGPKEVDGKHIEGSFRAHQVPSTRRPPEHLQLLEDSGCAATSRKSSSTKTAP
jgi:xylulose-5-phosphate/fructose-6-phosphate phosphoketolase